MRCVGYKFVCKYTGLKDNLYSLGIEIVSGLLTDNNISVLVYSCPFGTEPSVCPAVT